MFVVVKVLGVELSFESLFVEMVECLGVYLSAW